MGSHRNLPGGREKSYFCSCKKKSHRCKHTLCDFSGVILRTPRLCQLSAAQNSVRNSEVAYPVHTPEGMTLSTPPPTGLLATLSVDIFVVA